MAIEAFYYRCMQLSPLGAITQFEIWMEHGTMLGGSYASRHDPKETGIFVNWTPVLERFVLTWQSDDPSHEVPTILRHLDLELAEAIYITTAHELAQYSWRMPDSKPDCLILVLLWPHLELFVLAPTEQLVQ